LLKFVTKRLSTRVLACGLCRLQALEMLRALADTSLTHGKPTRVRGGSCPAGLACIVATSLRTRVLECGKLQVEMFWALLWTLVGSARTASFRVGERERYPGRRKGEKASYQCSPLCGTCCHFHASCRTRLEWILAKRNSLP
jgi:hypothetical protein